MPEISVKAAKPLQATAGSDSVDRRHTVIYLRDCDESQAAGN
jgi:hypothetical protein